MSDYLFTYLVVKAYFKGEGFTLENKNEYEQALLGVEWRRWPIPIWKKAQRCNIIVHNHHHYTHQSGATSRKRAGSCPVQKVPEATRTGEGR